MAQMLVQGVAIQGRTVINPGDFLKKEVGLDEAVVDSVRLPSCTGANNDNELDEMLERYVALEESMKKLAAKDDERLTT